MPFKPGDNNINRKGRKKGVPNRSSEMMKVNIARAVNMGLDYLKEDYEKIRQEDPAKALAILTKLMDFTLPRMKSVDMKVEGEITNKIEKITIEIKEPKQHGNNKDNNNNHE